jgi:pimeloyl-ACP methyl ester carboxylesterase
MVVRGRRVHALASRVPAHAEAVPVVLVHGFGMGSSYMVPLAARLAPEFPAYAPDLPGHGPSDKPPRVLDAAGLAEALLGWMDAVGLTHAAVVGHSSGCQVAIELAVRHPGRVDRLVLVAPAVDPAARSLLRQIGRMLVTIPAERPSLALLVLMEFARTGPVRLARELRYVLAYPMEERLPRLRVPSLIVRGTADGLTPGGWAREVVRLAGAGPLVELPGLGHSPNYSAPDALARAITPFLKAPRPTRARPPAGGEDRRTAGVG